MSGTSTRDEILSRHCISATDAIRQVGAVAADPELWAASARKQDEIFGVWSRVAQAFVYPDFQFRGNATSAYRQELFWILRGRVGFDPVTEDPGGWARAYWLYQPSGVLSERSLATADFDCSDPIKAALSLSLFNDDARSPAEVFGIAPRFVIALARALSARDEIPNPRPAP